MHDCSADVPSVYCSRHCQGHLVPVFSLHLVSKLCFDRLLGLQSRVLPFQEVHAYRLLLEQNSGTGFVECSLSPTPSPLSSSREKYVRLILFAKLNV